MSTENEGGYYYDLFKFFSEQHNLTLVDSEIEDIINAVEKFKTDKHYEGNLQAAAALDEDDDWDDDDYEEILQEELAECAAACSCGAWKFGKDGKVYHVADCCCGAE